MQLEVTNNSKLKVSFGTQRVSKKSLEAGAQQQQ